MAKIIDRRNKSMGGGDKRSVSNIQNIAIHYSATATGNTSSFENFWKGTHGWNTGGYHEVVLLNGDVELNYNADTISNGVGGQNTRMYNICYVGDGIPNAAQLKTLKERANYNRNRFGLSANAVRGHREFSGQSTSCPGLNMSNFRKSLDGASTVKPSKPAVKPSTTNNASNANLTVDGKWGKSTTRALQRALGTPVDGIISKQPRNSVSQSLYGDTVSFGSGSSNVIVALQRKVGANTDGKLGPTTIRSLQRYLGTVQDGVLSRPSLVVKELQRRLNADTF